MKTNRKLHVSVVLALVAVVISVFPVAASPAALPHVDPAESAVGPSSCPALVANANAVLARIDIPARRAEYAVIDRIASCLALAASTYTIEDRAEMPSLSGYNDSSFLLFKQRQAERMGR